MSIRYTYNNIEATRVLISLHSYKCVFYSFRMLSARCHNRIDCSSNKICIGILLVHWWIATLILASDNAPNIVWHTFPFFIIRARLFIAGYAVEQTCALLCINFCWERSRGSTFGAIAQCNPNSFPFWNTTGMIYASESRHMLFHLVFIFYLLMPVFVLQKNHMHTIIIVQWIISKASKVTNFWGTDNQRVSGPL